MEVPSAYVQFLRTIMPVAAHDVLRDLELISEERRQLLVQRRLHLWLHTWLLAHGSRAHVAARPVDTAAALCDAPGSYVMVRYND